MGRGKYHAKTPSRKGNVSILFAPQRLCASKLYSYPKLRHYPNEGSVAVRKDVGHLVDYIAKYFNLSPFPG